MQLNSNSTENDLNIYFYLDLYIVWTSVCV